ncbi:inactive ubiquitin carboxyl-terminal hydrolase MINDY-4B-like isoform X2 [Apostichopus japonicus]|uniref:inactive ubiquitin carboxyl-terminal hydrolase MINDY-4B-like isoform X2 n=1 Tax=Stichopus japonicus TaxID=307972 RepID=UPI003AB7387F
MAGSQAMDTAHLERLAKVLEINSNEPIKPPRSEESKMTRPSTVPAIGTKDPSPKEELLPGETLSMIEIRSLKRLLFEGRMMIFDDEWKKASFVFQSVLSKCPYGILAPQAGARGLIVCVQAYILKTLMFTESDLLVPDSNSRGLPRLSAEKHQNNALVDAMAAILWRAGERKRAVVSVLHNIHPGLLHTDERRMEHLAKRLRYFELTSEKQLKKTLHRELQKFTDQEGGGVLSFLYSLLLTRTSERLQADLQGAALLTEKNRCAISLLNLLLVGQATPYVFNGKILYDDDGNLLASPVVGILERSDIGLLIIDREKPASRDPTKHLGSMLKTPKFPIWVTSLNRHISVLFATNINLNRDWRSEQKFDLYYLNCQLTRREATKITVDTRTTNSYSSTTKKGKPDPKSFPIVEECISSRWPGARIDWNGGIPYF